MMKLGLTGSIATGKSEVAKRLAARGIPVFDADKAVHELYEQPDVIAQVARLFPQAIVDGHIDRSILGRHFVQHPEDLPRLEALVHPLVRDKREAFLQQNGEVAFAVFDIPLLYETGADKELDAVIVVSTTPALQRQRAMARPGMTAEKLDLILSRQLPMVDKLARADFVIETNGSLDDLSNKVDHLIPRLEEMAKARAK